MEYLIEKDEDITIKLELEEYIPLKIIFEEKEEPVDYIEYTKDEKSLLEITVGKKNRLLKRIILLLSEKYIISDERIVIDKLQVENAKLVFKENISVECQRFVTYLYKDGIRIVLSDKKSTKFVKMDTLYFGISDTNQITEICVVQLNAKEIAHIKQELELQ